MSISKDILNPKFTELFVESFGFTGPEFDRFLSGFKIQQLKKKEYFFRAGETCHQKAYVNKGCARTFVIDEEGHERILFFAFEDWWLADFDSYYSGSPGTQYVQALEDCELLVVTKEFFTKMERDIPKLQQWYTVKMQRSASANLRRITEMKTSTPEERYQNLISNQPSVFERVPLQYIASFLNIEPQSLSRIRHRLSKKA
jgi:CRP-like cAMP-binding protein